jgi:tetratricopeptide (TPR) repeat protein
MQGLKIVLIPVLVLGLGLAMNSACAQHEHHHDEVVDASTELGLVRFDPDCAEGSIEPFNRALALMHHMMYVQARAEFGAITETDPDCAMAWWGVATSLFQPLWGTRPSRAERDQGWAASQRALEQVDNDRERALIEATAAFFRDPQDDDFRQRVARWVEGMIKAGEGWPDDADVAALHALALLTRAQNDSEVRERLHDQAEAMLRDIWERKPTHPGAIHYSIHATDVDGRAENALDMVEVYGQIAPDTAHALHMPSHIYVRLGEWDEVIDWNVRSADAALKAPVNGRVSHHFIHAIDYLVYAYLQRGEDELAERIEREAMAKGDHQASFVSAFHLAAIPARLAVERRDWNRAVELQIREPDDQPWDEAHWPEAISWFALGLGRLHSGDQDGAREALDRLVELGDQARAAGEPAMATYIDVDRLILEAWIESGDGQAEAALTLLKEAVELEGTVEKHPVTPGALYPPREALGDLLMVQGQPEAALAAYRSAEQVWPGRYNTRLGAARAARAAGKTDTAARHYRQLLALAERSDRDGVVEARRFLATRGP